jgi:hypothetical protein
VIGTDVGDAGDGTLGDSGRIPTSTHPGLENGHLDTGLSEGEKRRTRDGFEEGQVLEPRQTCEVAFESSPIDGFTTDPDPLFNKNQMG